jgi:hypothetical protein
MFLRDGEKDKNLVSEIWGYIKKFGLSKLNYE